MKEFEKVVLLVNQYIRKREDFSLKNILATNYNDITARQVNNGIVILLFISVPIFLNLLLSYSIRKSNDTKNVRICKRKHILSLFFGLRYMKYYFT